MKWALMPLRRYAEFHGRSTRREFWLFHLFFYALIIAVALITAGVSEPGDDTPGMVFAILMGLIVLGLAVPMIAVSIRRLHDHDKSGWFYLLSFVPLVGWLIWLFIMLIPGTQGTNSYGDDPRDRSSPDLENVFA